MSSFATCTPDLLFHINRIHLKIARFSTLCPARLPFSFDPFSRNGSLLSPQTYFAYSNFRSFFVFTPGQLVVYPAQGVGKIERVDCQQVCGEQTEFFIVNILTSNIVLMVPIKSASAVGLRPLASLRKPRPPWTCSKISVARRQWWGKTGTAGSANITSA